MKADPSTTRAVNRRLILRILRAEGPTSRVGISSRSGLSAAAVTSVVADLIQEGLLVEREASKGAAGRRPIPVDINYGGRLTVGIKVSPDRLLCVLTDLSTTPIESLEEPVEDASPEGLVAAATRAIERFSARAEAHGAQIIGVGLALPGAIDTETGFCHRSVRLGWRDVPIGQMLARRIRLPVWIDDDTNAFALAQLLFGYGRQHGVVAVLAVGAGIGCAIIIDNVVNHGAFGSAGKLGHTTHDPSGPPCECGRRGCLQAMYSEPAIVARWRALTGRAAEATRLDMISAAEEGDEVARSVLADAGRTIGRYMAAFCNILDPEVLVVGGEAVAFGAFLLGPLAEELERGMLSPPPPVLPDWDDDSWARGAAALATRRLFDFEAASGIVGPPG